MAEVEADKTGVHENTAESEVLRDADEAGPAVKQLKSLILKAVLEDEPAAQQEPEMAAKRKFYYPMVADIILAGGLLIALTGFVIGMFRMYTVHHAQQCMTEGDYRAAIGMLKGNPFITSFNVSGDGAEELLNQALYMDAMQRLERDGDINGALAQLQQVKAGSHYFTLAQEILTDNFTPSETQLQGGVETQQALEQTANRQ